MNLSILNKLNQVNFVHKRKILAISLLSITLLIFPMQPRAEAFPFEDSEIVQSAKETVQGVVESVLETVEEEKDAVFQKATELYEDVNQWIADTRGEIQDKAEHDYNEYASGSESEKQEMDEATDDGRSALDYSGTVSAERAKEIAEELNKHKNPPEGVSVVGVHFKENATTGERETFFAIIDKENMEGEQKVTVLSMGEDGRFRAVSELNLQENWKEMQELYESIIHDNAMIEENYENSKTIGEKMGDDWLFRLGYLSGLFGMGIGLRGFLKKYDEITGKVKSVADKWYNGAKEVNDEVDRVIERVREAGNIPRASFSTKYGTFDPVVPEKPDLINFMSRDDPTFINALKTKPLDGYQDLLCHGTQGFFVIETRDGKTKYLDPVAFAEIVKKSPNYQERPIRLITCNAALENTHWKTSLAEDFANAIGVEVLAGNGYVYVLGDGQLAVTSNRTIAQIVNNCVTNYNYYKNNKTFCDNALRNLDEWKRFNVKEK